MFWRFNYLTSEIDTLLDKEDVTLQDILNEEDVLQECKAQNKKLVDFLVRPENFEQLVTLVIKEPSPETEERMRYKYPNIACELITSDVNQITDSLAEDTPLLTKLVNYLETDATLNPLQASFFSKVMGLLITRKSELTLNFLKTREGFTGRVLQHLDTSAIMDLLLRLITSMESTECKNTCVNWLSEQQVIQKLVRLLDHSQSPETHSNVAQSLCDIIRISREQTPQFQDQAIPDALLLTMESEETVTLLLDQMFNGEYTESVMTNGLYILQTLLEFKKNGIEGQQENAVAQEAEKMGEGASHTLKAIIPRLKDFHKLLLEPPKQHFLPMSTTLGILNQPLGNTRLQTVRLIAFLLANNCSAVNEELAKLGTLNTILNLYFEYVWNNFLHTQVEQCISAILKNESAENEHILLAQLIMECKLLEKIVNAFDENQRQQSKAGGHRRGYMGHLTRIANSIVNNRVSIQNSQKIDELVQGLADDLRGKWGAFVSGTLADLNKQNSTEFLSGSISAPSSADPDDGFRDIAFPPEVSMQKLGFTGDDFCEQEDMSGTVFRDLSNQLSSLSPTSCENSISSAALFDEICAARSRPKADGEEANEEDLWEEKELTFSPASPANAKCLPEASASPGGARGSESEDDDEEGAKDSSDSEEDLDSPWQIRQTPESSAPVAENNAVEDMEVSSEEWAKFDEVPMEVSPAAAPSPWAAPPDNVSNRDGAAAAAADGGWANFESTENNQKPAQHGSDNWANFSSMNWTEQEDASVLKTDASQVGDVRSAAYVVGQGEASGSTPANVTDSATNEASATAAPPSSCPVGSPAVENGPA